MRTSKDSRYLSQPQQAQKYQTSIVLALNKLKQTENKIYQTEKRLEGIESRNSKIQSTNQCIQQKNEAKSQVRKFIDQQKRSKQDYFMRRSFSIGCDHQRAQQQRIKHKNKLEELQKYIYTQNTGVYKKMRKQRVEQEQNLKKQKEKQLERKQNHRIQQRKRMTFMSQYKKKHEKQLKILKQHQILTINSRINQRSQYLQNLKDQEMKISRVRSRANPQEILKSSWGSLTKSRSSKKKVD